MVLILNPLNPQPKGNMSNYSNVRTETASPDSLCNWSRLPSPKQKFMGASRSTILRLIEIGQVRSSTVKLPGRGRGIRYFATNDFSDLIEKSMDRKEASAS